MSHSHMNLLPAALLILTFIPALAAEPFAIPQPGKQFTFPRDHGSHPEFRIEWWYVTANLKDSTGAAYGAQWTLFRQATRAGAQALTGPECHNRPSGHTFTEPSPGTGPNGPAFQESALPSRRRGFSSRRTMLSDLQLLRPE